MMTRPTAHRWTFPARFRRGASGRKSALPIQRLKEVVAEIRQVARKEPVVAADGAVPLLGKLSPALERLRDALQNDQMPYIERPGERWGELRVTPAMPPHGLYRYG